MTAPNTSPKDVVREALRRETIENTQNGLVLFNGQWIEREDLVMTKRNATARSVQHSIEVSLLIGIVCLVGVGFLALINLII